jgi:signal transduction histidine kinase
MSTNGTELFLERQRAALLGYVNQRVMHTMNNLLSGMYGMAQLAQATGKEEHAVKTVAFTVENCREMKTLTRSLADYSAGIGTGPAAVPLGACMARVQALLQHDLDKNKVRVKTVLDAQAAFYARPECAQDAFCRLMLDGLKALSGGGEIIVAAEPHDRMLAITFAGGAPVESSEEAIHGRLNGSAPVAAEAVPETRRDLWVVREEVRAEGGTFMVNTGPTGRQVVTVAFPIVQQGDKA